jgi:TctA family transporter
VITVLIALAALAYRATFGDLLLTAGFGVLGYAMKAFGWPRVSFVIALVLAALFETNLQLTMGLHRAGRLDLFGRPVFVVLLGVLVATAAWSTWHHRRRWQRRSRS